MRTGSGGRYLLGVTGGIGAGKTRVCEILETSFGAPRIDADALGHEALRPASPVLERIVERFGNGIRDEAGGIDRAKLAEAVFSGEEALHDLNGIVHPWILQRIREEAGRLKGVGPAGIILLDAALLLDWLDSLRPDGIVLVRAPLELRLQRLERRGLSREEAGRRIARQHFPSRIPAEVDWTIENDGSEQDLRAKAEALWGMVAARAGGA